MVTETLLYYLYEIDRIPFFSFMHISAFSCYFSYMINRLCAALCSWLITCFTFIRFINIFRQFNTIKSNLILLVSLFIIITIANSYSFIVLEYNSGQNSSINNNSNYETVCDIRLEYAENRAILLINILVAGVLNLALPSILILVVNVTILCLIKRVYSTQAYDNLKRRSDTTNYRSTRSTLLVISMTYTLFYIPYLIFYFLMIFLEDNDGTLFRCSEVTYILRHVSHSVNFYAYIFPNLRFRREILSLLHFLCRPCLNVRKRKQRTRLIILGKTRLPPLVNYVPINKKTEKIILKKQQEQNNVCL